MGFNIMRQSSSKSGGVQKTSPSTKKRGKLTSGGKNSMDISNRSNDSTLSSSSESIKPSKNKTGAGRKVVKKTRDGLSSSQHGGVRRKTTDGLSSSLHGPSRRKQSDGLGSSQQGSRGGKKKLGGGSLEDLMGVPSNDRVLKSSSSSVGGGRMPRRQSMGALSSARDRNSDLLSVKSEHGLGGRPKIRYQKSDSKSESAAKSSKKKKSGSSLFDGGSERKTVGPDRKIRRSKSGNACSDLDNMESAGKTFRKGKRGAASAHARSKPSSSSSFGCDDDDDDTYTSPFSSRGLDPLEHSVRERRMDERLQKEAEKNDELSKKVADLERQVQDMKYDNEQANRKLRNAQRDAEREISEKNKEINELSETVDRILEAERKVQGNGFGGTGASKSSATEERLREELRLANSKVQTLEKVLCDKTQENQKVQMELSCYRDSSKSSTMKTVEASLSQENADLQEKLKFKDETIAHLMDQLKDMKSGKPASGGGGAVRAAVQTRNKDDMDRSGHGMMGGFADTFNRFSRSATPR